MMNTTDFFKHCIEMILIFISIYKFQIIKSKSIFTLISVIWERSLCENIIYNDQTIFSRSAINLELSQSKYLNLIDWFLQLYWSITYTRR